MRSQTATSSSQTTGMTKITQNWSQSVTGSQKHRDPRFRPWVFTEHGAVMAANILHSERAVHMSVFVVRTFVRLREQIAANRTILKRLAEIDKTLTEHDTSLMDLYEKLLPLLQPPPDSPQNGSASSRREIVGAWPCTWLFGLPRSFHSPISLDFRPTTAPTLRLAVVTDETMQPPCYAHAELDRERGGAESPPAGALSSAQRRARSGLRRTRMAISSCRATTSSRSKPSCLITPVK